jgi:NAD(P)-dependent dehydrogenase (short-subunit alcohol dehydrogenase family)
MWIIEYITHKERNMTESTNLQNKTILITGATDGLGKQTALDLAKMGAHVIVHGRRAEVAQSACAAIRSASGNDRVGFLLADFASLDQVRALANEVLQKYDRLDVLINNAGLYLMERLISVDGHEMMLAVNHLAHFLLTNLLLDRLKASAPARIINVSSGMHQQGKIDLADLHSQKSFHGSNVYSNTKLANILFTHELAERLKGTGVTENALHPGGVSTKLFKGTNGISVEAGAATSVYLASSPDVANVTGKYFVRKQMAETSAVSHDRKLQKELWAVSARLSGLE